jgi:hypothetical protein
MVRLLVVLAIALAVLAMAQGQQNQFVPLPTRPLPQALIP